MLKQLLEKKWENHGKNLSEFFAQNAVVMAGLYMKCQRARTPNLPEVSSTLSSFFLEIALNI